MVIWLIQFPGSFICIPVLSFVPNCLYGEGLAASRILVGQTLWEEAIDGRFHTSLTSISQLLEAGHVCKLLRGINGMQKLFKLIYCTVVSVWKFLQSSRSHLVAETPRLVKIFQCGRFKKLGGLCCILKIAICITGSYITKIWAPGTLH